MKKTATWIVRRRVLILVVSLILLIPAAFGYIRTRVNYDILSYLPKEIETMKGQDLLVDEFGMGAFSFVVTEGMDDEALHNLREEMKEVDHVANVLSRETFAELSIPEQMIPEEIKGMLEKDGCELTAVIFDSTGSTDETMDAIEQLRRLAGKQCFISGMSAVVTDTRDLADQEAPVYIALAVLLCMIVLSLTMDSFLAPVFFLVSIGICILYNMGTNWFLGETSYITKALSAVLQLGVTLDYSIFLWHAYEEELARQGTRAEANLRGSGTQTHNETGGEQKASDSQTRRKNREQAMVNAIVRTFQSVIGSSVTTIAGFIALCFMSFTLGRDIGVVMAKGVLFGVLGCLTILPSMLLIFDGIIAKTHHKALLPEFHLIPIFVQKAYPVILVLFALVWIPATKGYLNTDVYYDLTNRLPDDLPGVQANRKLDETFDLGTTHLILADASVSGEDIQKMAADMEAVDGVKHVTGLDTVIDPKLPRFLVPPRVSQLLESEHYKLLFVTSEYDVATDEVNRQCDELSGILKKYDPNGMLIGEAACTRDLIRITDRDFRVVSWVSIGIIFLIILVVFKSVSLPVLLVATIEAAIFINLGIPYYTHTQLPFIASVVIGTIQLGSTVDYAILMTSRYQQERGSGRSRREAVLTAHCSSMRSIVVSACSFFAATFGVGLYSKIDMISALCTLMARGALISMVTVVFVLPSLLLAFDRVIIHTGAGFAGAKKKENNR